MSDKNRNQNDEIWVHDFTEESAKSFRDQMMRAVREAPHPNHPIVVWIDSYGGYVDSLAVMIETIDEVPNPVYTVCIGKAMSCGAVLLSHGDERFCGQHSRVMIHEVSAGSGGDVHDFLNDAKEAQRLNRHFMTLLAKNCGIKDGYKGLRKIIKQHDGRELWMDAKRAKRFGIVDFVGTPVIEAQIVYATAAYKRI